MTRRFEYDAVDRLTAVTGPSMARTGYRWQDYDPTGNLALLVLLDGGETRATYDALGRVAAVIGPTGANTTHEYDPDGRPLVQQEPTGTTTTRHDERGNVVERTDPGGAVVRYRIDDADRLVR